MENSRHTATEVGSSPVGQNASRLMSLPYEIRKIILEYATLQHGRVELQRPIWGIPEATTFGIFASSKALREEALEAYYNANTCLLIVDAKRAELSTYPVGDEGQVRPFTPQQPWRYPYLIRDLRNLNITIKLPPMDDGDAWRLGFRRQVESLVHSLDYGRRLTSLEVSLLMPVSQTPWRSPLTTTQKGTLDVLTELKVRANVGVSICGLGKGNMEGFLRGLDLARRIKR